MNLSSLAIVKELLEQHGIQPNRGLGQNFLVDIHPIKSLTDAAKLTKEDTVLEIGSGVGVLTKELAHQTKHVVTVEKDAKMIEILKDTLKEFGNVEIIHDDALNLDTKYKIPDTRYKLVANLPYYITAPTIRKFLEAENPPESITLIIQKEVAARICAKPPGMSILAVSVQFYAQAKVIAKVKKTAFWPQPHVDSSIVHIVPYKEKLPVEPKEFFRVVKAGFSHPRKQLVNNFIHGLDMQREKVVAILEKNNIQPNRRAETLTIQDWASLTQDLL